jgi:hypothetical protein
MATNITSYFGSTSPNTQGYQGQQGASQTPDPNVTTALRGTSWTPPPGSQSQPNMGTTSTSNTGVNGGASGSGAQLQESSYQNSPVTPSGGVNYQQTQRWSQPQTQPTSSGGQTVGSVAQSLTGGSTQVTAPPLQAAGQPTYADPFVAMGGGFWTGQQWVPRDHPLATQGQTQPQPTGTQPNPATYSPYGPYPGRPEGTVYQPGQMEQFSFQGYNPTQFNAQAPTAYQPGQVAQWGGGPDLSGLEAQQNALLQQAMAGGSMPPEMVMQMKERQKQDALMMQQQMGAQMMQGAAARGSMNGGANLAGQRNLAGQTIGNILGGYRDIDINAATQNYADKLSGLQASEGIAQGRFGRANQGYANTLQGQMAQEGLNQQGYQNQFQNAEFDLQRQGMQAGENQFGWQSQFAPAEFQRDSFLAQQGLNQQGAASQMGAYQTDLDAFFQHGAQGLQKQGLDNQLALGQGGLDIDRQRLASQENMFNQSLDLDWAQALNGMNMDRLGMGFNYAQLQQQAQARMQSALGF